jgi:hypothetical protein
MGTTISKNTTTTITEFNPWVSYDQGDNEGGKVKLNCCIKFNKPAKDINIKRIIVSKYSKYSYCSDDYIYYISGIKDNEIIVRKGPNWEKGVVYAKIIIEEDGNKYTLKSKLTKIQAYN